MFSLWLTLVVFELLLGVAFAIVEFRYGAMPEWLVRCDSYAKVTTGIAVGLTLLGTVMLELGDLSALIEDGVREMGAEKEKGIRFEQFLVLCFSSFFLICGAAATILVLSAESREHRASVSLNEQLNLANQKIEALQRTEVNQSVALSRTEAIHFYFDEKIAQRTKRITSKGGKVHRFDVAAKIPGPHVPPEQLLPEIVEVADWVHSFLVQIVHQGKPKEGGRVVPLRTTLFRRDMERRSQFVIVDSFYTGDMPPAVSPGDGAKDAFSLSASKHKQAAAVRLAMEGTICFVKETDSETCKPFIFLTEEQRKVIKCFAAFPFGVRRQFGKHSVYEYVICIDSSARGLFTEEMFETFSLMQAIVQNRFYPNTLLSSGA